MRTDSARKPHVQRQCTSARRAARPCLHDHVAPVALSRARTCTVKRRMVHGENVRSRSARFSTSGPSTSTHEAQELASPSGAAMAPDVLRPHASRDHRTARTACGQRPPRQAGLSREAHGTPRDRHRGAQPRRTAVPFASRPSAVPGTGPNARRRRQREQLVLEHQPHDFATRPCPTPGSSPGSRCTTPRPQSNSPYARPGSRLPTSQIPRRTHLSLRDAGRGGHTAEARGVRGRNPSGVLDSIGPSTDPEITFRRRDESGSGVTL